MPINILYFGDIDTSAVQDYYKTTIDLDNRTIQLDLNFESTAIAADKLHKLLSFLEEISGLLTTVEKFIYANIDDEEVQFFLDFHKEELLKEELDFLLENADQNLSLSQQILSVTQLRRIGFYPEHDNYFAVFDFGVDENISQYLLVVNMNSDKTINHITVES